jgi:hypothetical protein
MISRLLGGDIKTWDNAALRAGGVNAALANCHRNVTRVVRLDTGATPTEVVKNYLVNADDARSTTTTTCYLGGHWASLTTDVWPEDNGTFCSGLTTANTAGAAAQLAKCAATSGALCYADLPDALPQTTLIRPSLRNAVNTGFAAPVNGTRTSCSFGTLVLPGGGDAAGAVGLNASDSWATDNSAGDRADVTFQGAAYPVCELTFALVYARPVDIDAGYCPSQLRPAADAVRVLLVHPFVGRQGQGSGLVLRGAPRVDAKPSPVGVPGELVVRRAT